MKLRISIRWLMVSIAMLGLLLSSGQMWRIRKDRLLNAATFESECVIQSDVNAKTEKQIGMIQFISSDGPLGLMPKAADKEYLNSLENSLKAGRVKEGYQKRMAAWYKQRAARPWESLGEQPAGPNPFDGFRQFYDFPTEL